MFSLCGKVRDKAAVSNKPFISDARSHMSLVYKYMSSVTRGITTETYLTISVDKNTLHHPFKIKAPREKKSDLCKCKHTV